MFHEIRLPTGISYGSSGGPAFNTAIIRTDSGSEQRVARWEAPLRRYNLGYGIKSLDDLYAVQKFFIARQGPAFGFRFKDWSDFTTAANGRGPPSSTDQVLGIGDGITTTFQLRKLYADTASAVWRTIRKPVADTVLCALDGVSTPGFSVDTTTGIVTFDAPPEEGVSVSAGCEFDVPVRFGRELDNGLKVAIEAFEAGTIPDIPVEEIADNQSLGDMFPYGGHSEIVLTHNRTLTVADGRFVVVAPTKAGLSLVLPNPETMPTGGPYWFISQAGTYTFVLKNHAWVDLLTVGLGKSVIVCLTQDGGGTKHWYAL
jgi:uncharacterized protein (TIGR02217 family)